MTTLRPATILSRPASDFRAVKYRRAPAQITLNLPGLGERTWSSANHWLVDATAWPELVMDQFVDTADWQVIDGYRAMGF